MLYLIFNKGYAASTEAQVARTDLSSEAIRLVRALRQALSDEAEVTGLLALMLLTDARYPARTGPHGERRSGGVRRTAKNTAVQPASTAVSTRNTSDMLAAAARKPRQVSADPTSGDHLRTRDTFSCEPLALRV